MTTMTGLTTLTMDRSAWSGVVIMGMQCGISRSEDVRGRGARDADDHPDRADHPDLIFGQGGQGGRNGPRQ
jgi:hypothetical protein